jgi:hypothetical protein
MIESHDAVRTSPHPTFHPLMVGQPPTTFAKLSGGRGSLLFECIVNISLLCGTQGLVTPGFEPRIPSPLAGEGQGEGDTNSVSAAYTTIMKCVMRMPAALDLILVDFSSGLVQIDIRI